MAIFNSKIRRTRWNPTIFRWADLLDFIHKAEVVALNKDDFEKYQASLKSYKDNYAIEKHQLDEAEEKVVMKNL